MGTPDSLSASTSRWTVRTETSSSRASSAAVSWPRVWRMSSSETRREARTAGERTPKHANMWHVRPGSVRRGGQLRGDPARDAALGDEPDRNAGPVEDAGGDCRSLAGLADDRQLLGAIQPAKLLGQIGDKDRVRAR